MPATTKSIRYYRLSLDVVITGCLRITVVVVLVKLIHQVAVVSAVAFVDSRVVSLNALA